MSETFTATHEFHLLDGSVVMVRAELLGDWVAYEESGDRWSTNCGDTAVWWHSGTRRVDRLARVVKIGHRFSTRSNGARSHRYECECGKVGSWMRSDDRAADGGDRHHRDAVRLARIKAARLNP